MVCPCLCASGYPRVGKRKQIRQVSEAVEHPGRNGRDAVFVDALVLARGWRMGRKGDEESCGG